MKKIKIIAAVLVTAVILIYSGLLINRNVESDDLNPIETEFYVPTDTSVYLMARFFIALQLEPDLIINFPLIETADIQLDEFGTYMVTSYVDLENPFGETKKLFWVCKLVLVGDRQWKKIYIDFFE